MTGNGKAEIPVAVRRSVRYREGVQDGSGVVNGKGTAADLVGIVRVILRGQADADVFSRLGQSKAASGAVRSIFTCVCPFSEVSPTVE